MLYINVREWDNTVETVDQCETRKEARHLLSEYVLAFGNAYKSIYISQRSTKDWRNR